MDIDWTDMDAHITPHFTVDEALLLPSWSVHHKPTYTEKANIQILAERMERVREFLGKPIHVHCLIRPEHANCDSQVYHGHNYNSFVHGALNSMHIVGGAVDWHLEGFEGAQGCDEVRRQLLPHLEEFQLRMEDFKGPWIHTDIKPVAEGGRRYFKP